MFEISDISVLLQIWIIDFDMFLVHSGIVDFTADARDRVEDVFLIWHKTALYKTEVV